MSPDAPIRHETELERAIMADPVWREGAAWGTPRPGHPEGSVANHVRDVLANVERFAPPGDAEARARLRLVAILHDACKFQVRHQPDGPPIGGHHGVLARRLAERHVDDETVFELTELHDEAYSCWRILDRGRPDDAHRRADALVERLGDRLPLYLAFYRCDNATGDKTTAPYLWFRQRCADLRD